MLNLDSKKAIELRFLQHAQQMGTLVPSGKIECFERPDFKLSAASGLIGIEVTELMRPAQDSDKHSPVKIEAFHKKVVELAQTEYYEKHSDAELARVVVCFSESCGHDRIALAHSLVEIVRANICRTQTVNLSHRELPTGLAAISITPEAGPWHSCESGSFNIPQLLGQLGQRDQ